MKRKLRRWQFIPFQFPRLYLFSTVDLYYMILVHVLEDVRCVHQDPDGTRCRHQEENVKLQSIDHHRHVLPIFPRLYVQIFVSQMLGNELDSLRSFASFRAEQHGIGALRSPSIC